MKTLVLVATYLVGFGELWLAWYFWKTNSKNETRRVMSLFLFALSLWVLLSAFSAYRISEGVVALAKAPIFFFGALLLFALLHLIVISPYPLFRLDSLHRALFYYPLVILLIASTSQKYSKSGVLAVAKMRGQLFLGPDTQYTILRCWSFI